MQLPNNVLRNRYAMHQYVAKYAPQTRLYFCDENSAVLRDPAESVPTEGRYKFVLECNPTKRDRHSRKRLAVDDPIEWLHRQADRYGFMILAIHNLRRYGCEFIRHGHSGYLAIVRFVGVLRVTDSQLFGEAYHGGLGSAKRFGYGMLRMEDV